MADPTKYTPDFDFSNYQANKPSKPLPGQELDIELANIALTTSQTIDALKQIRRSDGAVNNKTIGYDQLKDELNGFGFNPPSEWETETSYIERDTVFANAGFYRAAVSHISGDFEDDLADGKWVLVADFTAATSEAQAFANAAGVSAGSAASSASAAGSSATNAASAANAAGSAADATAADRAATGQDRTATGQDREQTGLDADATAADRAATGQDREQTGLDRAAAAASAASIVRLDPPQGRLSLVSGMSLSTSDVVGATSIYYVPATGAYVPVLEGTGFVARDIGAQLTLALDSDSGHTQHHSANANFDLFVAWSGTAVFLGSGPAWTAGPTAGSNTARGAGAGSTELESFKGLLVNKNAIQLRTGAAAGSTVTIPARQATFVGSFRPTANGQATDSVTRRLVSNAYNAVLQPLFVTDATASHTYSTAAYRSYNGDANNRLEVLSCLVGTLVDISVGAVFTSSTSTARSAAVAVGIDSTTVAAPNQIVPRMSAVANSSAALGASWRGYPGLGYHQLNWLQKGGGTDVQTWLGTPGSFDVGMSGVVAA